MKHNEQQLVYSKLTGCLVLLGQVKPEYVNSEEFASLKAKIDRDHVEPMITRESALIACEQVEMFVDAVIDCFQVPLSEITLDLGLLGMSTMQLSEVIEDLHDRAIEPVHALKAANLALSIVEYVCTSALTDKKEEPMLSEKSTITSSALIKPSDLVKKCDEYVLGQDHVKKAVATYIASHYNSLIKSESVNRPSLLITGPSGTGKSYIVSQMAKALDKPFETIDASEITPSGYKGRTLHEIMDTIAYYHKDAIIFIDEIDKLTCFNHDGFDTRTQSEFLKMIEQYSHTSDTKFCFIFAGAFEAVRKTKKKNSVGRSIGFSTQEKEDVSLKLNHDDLIKSGIMVELAGRIGTIVETDPIKDDMLYDLLTKPKGCVKEYYNKLFSDQGITDAVSEDDLQAILKRVSGKHSSLGVRGLKGVSEEYFRDRLYF